MNKEILKLAIPNILSNISLPLLSTVDTALMGRMSAMHIGAVGIGSMLFNYIYWNFGFLRMGTTGLTAQAYGKQDEAAIIHTLGRAIIVVIVLAIMILLLQSLIGDFGIYLMNLSGEQAALTAEYFYIRIWAAPATLLLYAFMGWFFGMQNAILPLILTIVINIVNIVFSYGLIEYAGMGVDGVAWGSVIAQYTGAILAFLFFLIFYKQYISFFSQKVLLQFDRFKEFLVLNRDIFIRTLCLTTAFGIFYSQSGKGSETILAVNVILLQFLNWMSYGVDGFAFAAESLVGKYKGSNSESKTRKAVRLSLVWGMGLGLLFSLVYGLFFTSLLSVFTNQANVIQASMPYLWWMILLPIIGTPCYIWDGIYVGMTASKSMRDSMLVSFVIYLLSFYILADYFGNHGLWLALVLFLAARGLMQTWLYQRKGWSLN